jgi:hypothetical protein
MSDDVPGLLVIACGAIARELVRVVHLDRLAGVEITCLPPDLHNRPERIPDAVRARIREARHDGYDDILVGYADCGTGGLLDVVCAEEGVSRLPGAHCYELFAGAEAFASLQEDEPGTFYLTDYLVRNVDRLVFEGLGIDRHPELRDLYFGNYRRVVHLAQTDDPELDRRARLAADRLGLAYERRSTGLGSLPLAMTSARGALVGS